MSRSLSLPLAVCLFAAPLAAQTPAPAPAPAPPRAAQSEAVQPSGVTLTTGTQLVVVDVVVQDKAGHPIHGLTRSDFALVEGKTPQTIKSMEEHTAADLSHAKIQKLPPMPPGIFTDYTPVPEDSPLNILLLDTLNTPMTDQAYVRYQLQQYVKHAQPGLRIAIFGLTSRLIMLQGFSSDPEILKDVVEHKLIPRASVLLDDAAGTNTDPVSLSDTMSEIGASASAVAGMQQFEAETASFQTQLRTQYTLDAFNQLARYLAAFPGRKNLIWFSGSFPLSIFPDPTLENPFSVQTDSSDELRQTTSLLARARVAVYPIDARGLQTNPMFAASRSGAGYARNPGKMTADIGKFNQTNAQEHMTMDEIADETGGHAFYNTNGLADAVAKSIDSGANYYTIAYTPVDRKWTGDYRAIHLKLLGHFADENLKLSYRNGYYADDPNGRKTTFTSSIVSSDKVATPAAGTDAYGHAAMMRGAPTPSELLFKARILPDSTRTEDALNPHNQPNPNIKLKGPFRLYNIDIAAIVTDFALKQGADGVRTGAVELTTYVYDTDGKLLNADGGTIQMNLKPETYAQLRRAGLQMSEQISAPAKGESFLRIGLHDLTSGRYGVIEVPTSTISHLQPAALPAAAPKANPAPATPTPTTVPPSR